MGHDGFQVSGIGVVVLRLTDDHPAVRLASAAQRHGAEPLVLAILIQPGFVPALDGGDPWPVSAHRRAVPGGISVLLQKGPLEAGSRRLEAAEHPGAAIRLGQGVAAILLHPGLDAEARDVVRPVVVEVPGRGALDDHDPVAGADQETLVDDVVAVDLAGDEDVPVRVRAAVPPRPAVAAGDQVGVRHGDCAVSQADRTGVRVRLRCREGRHPLRLHLDVVRTIPVVVDVHHDRQVGQLLTRTDGLQVQRDRAPVAAFPAQLRGVVDFGRFSRARGDVVSAAVGRRRVALVALLGPKPQEPLCGDVPLVFAGADRFELVRIRGLIGEGPSGDSHFLLEVGCVVTIDILRKEQLQLGEVLLQVRVVVGSGAIVPIGEVGDPVVVLVAVVDEDKRCQRPSDSDLIPDRVAVGAGPVRVDRNLDLVVVEHITDALDVQRHGVLLWAEAERSQLCCCEVLRLLRAVCRRHEAALARLAFSREGTLRVVGRTDGPRPEPQARRELLIGRIRSLIQDLHASHVQVNLRQGDGQRRKDLTLH